MAFLRSGRLLRNCISAAEKSLVNIQHRRCQSNVTEVGKPAETVSLSVIGAGPPVELVSLLVSTSHQEGYLFNCGEECARFLAQDQHRIADISYIFFTQVKWSCIGGISSLNSIFYKIKKRLFQYYGPMKLFGCMRRILCLSIMKEVPLEQESFNAKFFENDSIRIDFVSITPDIPAAASAQARDINEVIVYLCTLKLLQPDGGRAPTYFLVVDLPSVAHVKALARNRQLKTFLETMNKSAFELVADFTPSYILATPEYQQLMLSFSSKMELHLNRNKRFSYLRTVYELQARLHCINDKMHPQLKLGTSAWNNPVETDDKVIDTIHMDGTGMITTKYRNVPDVPEEKIPCINRLKSFPKIVFLGTSGTTQTPYRAVSSILVHTGYNKSMLLDCGEGTTAQIHRLYGHAANRIFANIKAIFVSHLHYDHYGGLVEFILARRQFLPAKRPPLLLMCPKQDLKSWLFYYDNTIEAIHDDLFFIENENLSRGLKGRLSQEIGVRSFHTCRVPHFNDAYAASMVIDGRNPFKLTFSGDTTVSDDLVRLGSDSNLLIHEATFTDRQSHLADASRHSTVSQAIEQGRNMNAAYTILTHFHPKFNSFPVFDTKRYQNIGIAYDNMEIVEADLPQLSKMYEKYRQQIGHKLQWTYA